MKYRYFYAAVTVAAVLLCIPGCSEGASENTTPKTALSESSENDSDSNEPSETTAVSTLTPLQTLIKITDFPENTVENLETEESFEENDDDEKITEASDRWFSAHSIFTMKMQGEKDFSDDDKNETIFRFSSDSETTSTKASAAQPSIKISGFKENND